MGTKNHGNGNSPTALFREQSSEDKESSQNNAPVGVRRGWPNPLHPKRKAQSSFSQGERSEKNNQEISAG